MIPIIVLASLLLLLLGADSWTLTRLSTAQHISFKPSKDMYERLDVYFEDLHMMVEGKEFFVKGVSYNPFPLGVQSMNIHGPDKDYGGGGFCSAKSTMFAEDKSACFGSDMFDGSPAPPDRSPPGPTGPWWKPVWERDFAYLKQLGINTLRVYNLNPYTKHLLETRSSIPGVIDPQLGAQHLPFLDYAHENGFKVILPIVTDQTMLMLSSHQFLTDVIESQVEELGNHPALLAFLVGNELGLDNNPALLNLVNRMMHKVRWYTFQYWNRTVPVSTALIDNPDTYDRYIRELDVDFFTINVFRSISLQSLFEPDVQGRFMGWEEASKQHNLPLLLGEFGEHQQTKLTEEIPDWFNQQWKAIVDNMDNGLVGAIFFEYCDEPYTKTDNHQQDMGIVRFEPAYDDNNRSSIEPDVFVPDRVVRKRTIFRSVSQGLPGSRFARYNMRSDVWELNKREPLLSKKYDQSHRTDPSTGDVYPSPGDSNGDNDDNPEQPKPSPGASTGNGQIPFSGSTTPTIPFIDFGATVFLAALATAIASFC